MKFFIAYPFSKIMDDETGRVNKTDYYFLNYLRDSLLAKNYSVFLAHFRENWGKDLMTDRECTQDDYKEMTESDYILAFPGNPISGGVHVELGWASSLNKKIHLFLKKGVVYSPLVTGLGEIADVTYHYYEGYTDLRGMIEKLLMQEGF